MQNLKITFRLINGLVIGRHPIHFDALLLFAKTVAEYGAKALTPEGRLLPTPVLPLEKYGRKIKVYHGSIGFPEAGPQYQRMYTKQWGELLPEFKTASENRLFIGKGWSKAYQNYLRKMATPSIYFYARGDQKEIEQLLPYISHIGAKGSQGHGMISSYEIEVLHDDYSIMKDGKPMRVIPYTEWEDKSDVFLTVASCTPPYDSTEKMYCVSPDPSMWQPLWYTREKNEKILD